MTDDTPDTARTEQASPAGARRRLLHVPTPGPVKFLGRARRAAENLPFAGEAFKRLRDTEDWAVAELKHRMDGIGESAPWRIGAAAAGSPAQRLAELFEAARTNSSAQARELMYMQVLDQMVPEQARLLAVVAQDSPTVMCHVDAGPPVGPTSRRVLSFATGAGKDAGIVLRDDVPRLVAQMVALGVFEEGPEGKNLKAQYEMLETENCVRQAMTRIKQETSLWPRVQRRTLRLTAFGADFWADTRPAGLAPAALTSDTG